MSDYYSVEYQATNDYKVVAVYLDYYGNVTNRKQIANLAPIASLTEDDGLARLVAEKMAKEFAQRLSDAYTEGWTDSNNAPDYLDSLETENA